MKLALDFLFLRAEHKLQIYGLMILISAAYFFNFSVNDIWTPNESFYAESVREMFESGNFFDLNYNYEKRYNKPPLTYWAMALSAGIFGVTEFALRLPIVLFALGSIWLTYLLGKELYGQKAALYSLIMMAFSVQLLAVKQYASPEIPLTFFFTLTMYWFVRGFIKKQAKYVYLSYLGLGLTTLTKGFPYIIVIGGIIGLYVMLFNQFNLKRIYADIKRLKILIGLFIVLAVGLSWVILMYLKDGHSFWEVYYTETFGRALSKPSNGLKPFFYFEVISWSVLPYTLAFIGAIIFWVKSKKEVFDNVLFPVSWMLVMLIIFTLSKGKLPTYMIQIHPAVFLFTSAAIVEVEKNKGRSITGWSWSFYLISLALIGANFFLSFNLDLNWVGYALPVLATFLLVLIIRDKRLSSASAAPFWVMLSLLLSFSTVLPKLEKYRPYDHIGQVINADNQVNKNTPLLIQETLIHNMPYYAQRRVIRDASLSDINSNQGESLALVRKESKELITSDFETLWEGLIYDYPSESQFFKFVSACVNAENGDLSKFAEYSLIYRPK